MIKQRPDKIMVDLFKRLVIATEKIASAIDTDTSTFKMRDVDRANVYKEHLGKKLSS